MKLIPTRGTTEPKKYWLTLLGGTGSDLGQGIVVDNSGNVYVAGSTSSNGAGSDDIIISKYDTFGTIQWQRTLGGTGTDLGQGIVVDNSGNVYVTGFTNSDGAGSEDILISKYNTSGTIQWQRTLGGTGIDAGRGIAVDNSGNVYVTGSTKSDGAGGSDIIISKYNTSGTIQWQRTLGGTGTEDGRGIVVDNSGNVYVTGSTSSGGSGGYDTIISKYNTSGTIQWQRTLGGTGADLGQGIVVDNSGNVYVAGSTTPVGYAYGDILISKYNTSGAIQWQRTLGGTSFDYGEGIAVDSEGNVYVIGYTSSNGAGSNDIIISKYNTSGTIQWQRTLGGTGTDRGEGIAVDSEGNVYVIGYTNSDGAGSNDILIAKLPSDGSLTGYIGGLIYQESTLTDKATALTDQVAVLTDQPALLTDQVSLLTDEASTLTD